MKKMTATKLSADCLAIIDRVHATGEEVLITKRGRPVVKLVPVGTSKSPFGCLRGIVKIVGDIESPAVPLEDWDALKQDSRLG